MYLELYKAAHVVRRPRLNGTNAGFYIIWYYRHPSSASVLSCPSICNWNASSTQESISNFVSPVAHCTFWTFRARPTSAKGSGYCAQFLPCDGQRAYNGQFKREGADCIKANESGSPSAALDSRRAFQGGQCGTRRRLFCIKGLE